MGIPHRVDYVARLQGPAPGGRGRDLLANEHADLTPQDIDPDIILMRMRPDELFGSQRLLQDGHHTTGVFRANLDHDLARSRQPRPLGGIDDDSHWGQDTRNGSE